MNYIKNERFFKLKKEDMVDSEGLNYITQFRGEYKNSKIKRRKKYNIRKKNKKDQVDIVTFSICVKDENLYLKLKKNDSNIKTYNINDNDAKASFIDDIENFISKPSANVQSIYQTVDEILNVLKLSFKKDTIIRVIISTYSTDSYVLFFKQDESSDIQGESNYISLSEEDIVSLVCINKDHRIYYDMKTDYVIIHDFTYLYDMCVGFGNRINKSTKTIKFGNYRMGHYKDDIIKLRYKCIPVLFKKSFTNIFSEQKYEKLKWNSHFPQYDESGLDDLTKHVIFYGGSANKFCTLTLKNGSTVELEGNGELTSEMIDTYRYDIVNVEIGNLCTSIGGGAFQGCGSLTSAIIGSNVTNIGDYAFSGCTGLTSITIPDSVTSIGNSAFRYCRSLNSITIPDSVTSVGNYALGYCTGLTDITIPDSVTSISQNTFSGCTGLTNITIPDSVTIISSSAFYNCTGLTNVTIGNSVTSIGSSAFYGCTGLTRITIPDSVTSIDTWAFANCSSLKSIIVDAANTIYDSRNNCNAIIKTKTNVLIQGCKTTIIPDNVTDITIGAFNRCTGLTSITIPDSVTSIGDDAFGGCTGLTYIIIGNSVASIGNSAFNVCTGLTSIISLNTTAPWISSNAFEGVKTGGTLTVPTGSTGYDAWMRTSNYYLGKYNWTIKYETYIGFCKLTLNDGSIVELKGSGELTFSMISPYKSTLVSVEIGNLCTNIGDDVFYKYTRLTSITIHDNVKSIGSDAFSGCTGLTNITIPDSVKSIGSYAFNGCTGLTNITIPDSVTNISSSAFYNCSGLTNINVNSDNITYDSRNNCNAIIETATNTLIQGCNTTIIPDNITSIGHNAFHGCTGLTSITVPDSVKSIDSSAFGGCSSLTSITIGNGVTSIGGSAFYGCSGLTSIIIGSSVTSINSNAFEKCTDLTSITSLATIAPTIASSTFRNIKIGGTLTVPSESTGYDVWMGTGDYYLGKYNWTKVEQ